MMDRWPPIGPVFVYGGRVEGADIKLIEHHRVVPDTWVRLHAVDKKYLHCWEIIAIASGKTRKKKRVVYCTTASISFTFS